MKEPSLTENRTRTELATRLVRFLTGRPAPLAFGVFDKGSVTGESRFLLLCIPK